MFYYGLFKEGFLPEAGGVADQSNSLMDALRIISLVNGECDEEAMEKQGEKKGNPFQEGNHGRSG